MLQYCKYVENFHTKFGGHHGSALGLQDSSSGSLMGFTYLMGKRSVCTLFCAIVYHSIETSVKMIGKKTVIAWGGFS